MVRERDLAVQKAREDDVEDDVVVQDTSWMEPSPLQVCSKMPSWKHTENKPQ